MAEHGEWQVQEAKSTFSALTAEAERHGPQSITKHGQPVAVLLSVSDYERLRARPQASLVDFLASAPLGELVLPERARHDFAADPFS